MRNKFSRHSRLLGIFLQLTNKQKQCSTFNEKENQLSCFFFAYKEVQRWAVTGICSEVKQYQGQWFYNSISLCFISQNVCCFLRHYIHIPSRKEKKKECISLCLPPCIRKTCAFPKFHSFFTGQN